MAGDSIGKAFRVTNWGESHGPAIGAVIEGVPPNIELCEEDIQKDLDRRRPGQSALTTPRNEADRVEILSGVYNGRTTGAPISLLIKNKDVKKSDYDDLKQKYRPSHADFTYHKKYGIRDPSGGGRSSARMTAGHVAAGAIAKKVLADIEVLAFVKSVGKISTTLDPMLVTAESVESNPVRCPDKETARLMEEAILEAKEQGDSLGGVIECVITGVPVGLGEPIFDKLEADLAKAMLAINATKGFEIGSGFQGTTLKGSEHNDIFEKDGERIVTRTNRSGGVQGGISNGMPIIFRTAFKPTSTISSKQKTVNVDGQETEIAPKGRHDPCVVPRAVPIVEAMALIVLCDHYLRDRGQCGKR